jgi:serine/threonine protein phosphatase PrpC
MISKLLAHGTTHKGSVRENNEDAYLYDAELGLVVVADGMGGHAAGEVASQIACEAVQDFITKSENNKKITWPLIYRREFSREWNRLLGALSLANGRILKYAKDHQKYLGMGTTVVAALFKDEKITYAHVGDSRLYHLTNGTFSQLTEDHSWVQEQIKIGNLTPEQAEHHPLKNVVTRALGGAPQVYVDLAEKPFGEHDIYLFCTDGLTGGVSDAAIAHALKSNLTLSEKARELIEMALDAGGPDNITIFLVEVFQDK